MSDAPALEVRAVRKRFGGLVALESVHLDLPTGQALGLIGPNGSGKTTLLSIIAGRLAPSAGAILLDGAEVTAMGAARRCRAGIGATFQLVRLTDSLSALDNVAVAAMYGRRRMKVTDARRLAGDLLRRVGFAGRAGALPRALTYFDQKRVELARALATDPRILLLDEWLAGLTPTELSEAISLIRALHRDHGLSLVIVEHVMAAIRSLCERVIVLDAGAVIAVGTPEECLGDPEVVRVYLGDDGA
jgi:branched-chain amino acid transport system ATP-binding protein